MGVKCVNYIDDKPGAEDSSWAMVAFPFFIIIVIGLKESVDMDCFPATTMVFVGLKFDIISLYTDSTTCPVAGDVTVVLADYR